MYLGFWHGGTLTLEPSHLLSYGENTSIHLLSSWQTLLWFNFDYCKLLKKTGDGRPWERLTWTVSFCGDWLSPFSTSSFLMVTVYAKTEWEGIRIKVFFSCEVHISCWQPLSVTTCDTCAMDHVVRFTRLSPSIFAYCKWLKTGGGEGLGTRLDDWLPCTALLAVYIEDYYWWDYQSIL